MLINDNELWELLQSDENDQLDFKSAELLTDPNGKNRYKIAKHLVGFSNHRGGKLVFGVNDEGEPEGEYLNEEECLSTISEIANSQCSPGVKFTHKFYSDKRGHLSDGSIFALDIKERTNLPPVAIVGYSEGKVRKREYRIRSGDSTRLVSDGELLALFEESPELEFECSSKVVYTHSADLETVDITPRPPYFFEFDNFYRYIGDDRDDILDIITKKMENDSDWKQYHVLFKRAMILCLLANFYTVNRNHLLEKLGEKIQDENSKIEYNFNLKDASELEYPDDDMIFGETSLEVDSYLNTRAENTHIPNQDGFGFFVPENSTIEVSSDFSSIDISVEDEFEFRIFFRLFQSGTGLPEDHPESRYDRRHGTGDPDSSKITHRGQIKFVSNFKYPQQSYGGYLTSKHYCKELSKLTVESYDWEEFVDSFPNKKIYHIEDKLDDLGKKLDKVLDEDPR